MVNLSENKFLFLAFCIEMKRFNNYLSSGVDKFYTYLPIQLDGTCNGFQHLALLSNETNLFDSLNLAKASKSDNPKDFYQFVIYQLMILLEEKKHTTKDPKIAESWSLVID